MRRKFVVVLVMETLVVDEEAVNARVKSVHMMKLQRKLRERKVYPHSVSTGC